MHTRTIEGYRFHFNSDASGDLCISAPSGGAIRIPFGVLRLFIDGRPLLVDSDAVEKLRAVREIVEQD